MVWYRYMPALNCHNPSFCPSLRWGLLAESDPAVGLGVGALSINHLSCHQHWLPETWSLTSSCSEAAGGLCPSSAWGWGPKEEEPLHSSPVECIQVERARGCWGPCLVLGDRAVLVLGTMVAMAT